LGCIENGADGGAERWKKAQAPPLPGERAEARNPAENPGSKESDQADVQARDRQEMTGACSPEKDFSFFRNLCSSA